MSYLEKLLLPYRDSVSKYSPTLNQYMQIEKAEKLYEELAAQLTKEQKELLFSVVMESELAISYSNSQELTFGFQTAIKMILECLSTKE